MSRKLVRKSSLFFATLLIGLMLMGVGFALEQYYKSHIADKNGDGEIDWHDVDVNNDKRVDMCDIGLIARLVGSPTTAETSKYDINEDGFIDEWDVELAASFFGQSLSILNLYTNQGKVFTTGLILSILSVIGIVVSRRTKP